MTRIALTQCIIVQVFLWQRQQSSFAFPVAANYNHYRLIFRVLASVLVLNRVVFVSLRRYMFVFLFRLLMTGKVKRAIP